LFILTAAVKITEMNWQWHAKIPRTGNTGTINC